MNEQARNKIIESTLEKFAVNWRISDTEQEKGRTDYYAYNFIKQMAREDEVDDFIKYYQVMR